jgi:hypothetical protein
VVTSLRSFTRSVRAVVAAVVVVLAATACFPQGGASPTYPPLPAGGRILFTGGVGYSMSIEDASPDLSRSVVALVHYDPTSSTQSSGRFYLYDDATRTTTLLPVPPSYAPTTVRLVPDGHRILFSSNDPTLQSGPVAKNCVQYNGFFQPLTFTYCAEIYLYDLADGSIRQMTGLGGSSPLHNELGDVAPDGTTVDYISSNPIPEGGSEIHYRRLDLVTGASVDIGPPGTCCSWVRGNHRIVWNPSGPTPSLTSEDLDTGEVTTLISDDAIVLVSRTDDGRFAVLENDVLRFHVIDTDTGADRLLTSRWISEDGSRYLVAQQNVLPENRPRLVVAAVPW